MPNRSPVRPISEERRAARAVALQTKIPKRGSIQKPGRRELLEMLGLLDAAGVLIEPEPAPEKARNKPSLATVHGERKQVTAQADTSKPLRDRSTLPAGLRNLPKSAAS